MQPIGSGRLLKNIRTAQTIDKKSTDVFKLFSQQKLVSERAMRENHQLPGEGDSLFMIHSKQASLLLWQQRQQNKDYMPQQVMQKTSISKPFFSTLGKSSVNVRRMKERRLVSQGDQLEKPFKQNSTKPPQDPALQLYNQIKVDPKIRRTLSQQSKQNFLQFLLVQKAGHKNDSQLLEFFQKEYNYQLPEISDLQKTNNSKGSEKVMRKSVTYLLNKEETEQQIENQINTILTYNSQKNFDRKKKSKQELEDNIPLDEYIIRQHENKVRGLKNVQLKQKAAELKLINQQYQPMELEDEIKGFKI